MKVSCGEGVASHTGPESCGDDRKVVTEALTGESAGRVLSLENVILWGADAFLSCGRQKRSVRQARTDSTPRGHRPRARTEASHAEAGRSQGRPDLRSGPRFEPARGTRAMHDLGKSDGFVVPAKFPNNAGGAPPAAEGDGGKEPSQRQLRCGTTAPDSVPA